MAQVFAQALLKLCSSFAQVLLKLCAFGLVRPVHLYLLWQCLFNCHFLIFGVLVAGLGLFGFHFMVLVTFSMVLVCTHGVVLMAWH